MGIFFGYFHFEQVGKGIMPRCSICKSNFVDIRTLIIHLRNLHNCGQRSIYNCGELNCDRSFSTLNSFKKHLNIVHSKNTVNENVLPEHSELTVYETLAEEIKFESFQDIQRQSDKIDDVDQCSEFIENDFLQFDKTLRESTIAFICNLYGKTTFSRKDVQIILSLIKDLFQNPLQGLKDYIDKLINPGKTFHYFSKLQNMFSGLESEHLRFKYLESTGYLIKPEEFIIGQRLDKQIRGIPMHQSYKAQFVSLRKIFKQFFELPEVFPKTIAYMNHLKVESDAISNIIQTDPWKNKLHSFEKDDIVIPFFIYFDEYECGNPLGSHAGIQKLGAIYCSIPTIPYEYQAQLDNIFLAMLFHSADLKEFGSNIIYSKLVEECKYLESTGIEITINDKTFKVYFCLASLLGDNLGLNCILGFTECFRANYYCRFCKCSRTEMESYLQQNDNKMRNRTNYKEDLNVNSICKTGIKQPCIFNEITSFHVTENFSVDISHDIFEGIALFDMTEILYQIIMIDKLFTVETFNMRLKYFNFGKQNINKPPLLTIDNIKRKKINMSCSEMKNFILYAGLMLSNLIPKDNPYWNLYIYLRRILRIVFLSSVSLKDSDDLKTLIASHHSLYKELFNLPLKPKHHLLTHYPMIMLKAGPVKYLSTLRFESKHRQSKLNANVVSSRVNVTSTLALKHQLILCQRLISRSGFKKSVSLNDGNLIEKTNCNEELEKILSTPNEYESFKHSLSFSKLTIHNFDYSLHDIILIERGELPIFGTIKKILVNNKDEIGFIYDKIVSVSFDDHLFAYEVVRTKTSRCILECHIIFCSHLMSTISSDGKEYITLF